MYNYFLLIGHITQTSKGSFSIMCGEEELEIEFDLPETFNKAGTVVAVKGYITAHGLIGERITAIKKEVN